MTTQCIIAGGGPAGMMLGLLLARAGVNVVVLEKHADFFRDFRGDTIHPSTLEIMEELGLLDELLALPHQKAFVVSGQIGEMSLALADFSHLPVTSKFIAFMPQWDFLNFLAEKARAHGNFRLEMDAEVIGLLYDGDRVSGVRITSPAGERELRADLVVGADGRSSDVREAAKLEPIDFGAPMDVLWMRLSRKPNDPKQLFGRIDFGRIFVMIDRGDYWQCALVIRKGAFEAIRARGLDALRADILQMNPFLHDRVAELRDWNDIKLLTVQVNRLREWFRPGLLCIGDAAHAMSPVAGVGINLAIQDAVAAANILIPAFRRGGSISVDTLKKVQDRRELPTRVVQRVQLAIQNNIITRVLDRTGRLKPPLAIRAFAYIPLLRRIPARLIGLGFRREHVDPSLRTGAVMQRREFVQRSATLAGGAAILGVNPAGVADSIYGISPAVSRGRAESIAIDPPPPISENERAQRREKAQRLMRELGVAAMLIEPGASMNYFAGIDWGRSERLFAFILPQSGKPVVISPAFEQQRAEDQVNGRFDVRVWQEDQSPYALVATAFRDWGIATGRFAIDGSARTFVFNEIGKAVPALQMTTAEPIVNACRGVKTAHEIEIMRYANQITLDVYREALKTLRVGMSQSDLARTIAAGFSKLGYQGGAFVLFGESSAYPHGLPKPRTLRENEVVLIDGGTSVHGYASDMTRTVVFGTPSPEAQKVFDIVHEAQRQVLAFAAPGRTCGEVDAVARKVVTDAGYGPDYRTFTHRVGHGIGMEGHEWPYLVRGSKVVLQPGMTFSDEPGIYQYGKFGVRLEDIMAITPNGAEMLTPTQGSLSPSL